MTTRSVRVLLVAGGISRRARALLRRHPDRERTPLGAERAAGRGDRRAVQASPIRTARTVTDQDLKGRPFLVFFGFTHCPDVCPDRAVRSVRDHARARPRCRPHARAVRHRRSRARHAGDAEGLSVELRPASVGLTGDPDAIAAVAKAYRVYFKKVPLDEGGYTMDHTAIVYLMDKDGPLRRALQPQADDRGRGRRSARSICEPRAASR